MTEQQFDEIVAKLKAAYPNPPVVELRANELSAPKLIRPGTLLLVERPVIRTDPKALQKWGNGFSCLIKGSRQSVVVRYQHVELVSTQDAPSATQTKGNE